MSIESYTDAKPQRAPVTLLSRGDTSGANRTTSSGFSWRPRVTLYPAYSRSIVEQLAEATPRNTELLKWAARPENQPPQSWWDDTTDPFEPAGD